MLYGLTNLDSKHLKGKTKPLMRNLLKDINSLAFHAIGNDFVFHEWSQLYEVYVNLKIDKDKRVRNMVNLFNTTLRNALEYKE